MTQGEEMILEFPDTRVPVCSPASGTLLCFVMEVFMRNMFMSPTLGPLAIITRTGVQKHMRQHRPRGRTGMCPSRAAVCPGSTL